MRAFQRTQWLGRVVTLCVALLYLMTMPFVQNVQAASSSAGVTIPVSEVFTNNGSSGQNATFDYHLQSLDSSNPLPEGRDGQNYVFTITGTTDYGIEPILFAHAGVYSYKLSCDTSNKGAGYTYDTKVYTIVIYVRNSGSGLAAEIVARDEQGEKVSTIAFTHSYTPSGTDPALMVDPPVRKVVQGNPSEKSTFQFSLTAQEQNNPMPQGSSNGVKTVSIVGSGEAEFGTWPYTKAGVYTYKVDEVDTHSEGYRYDNSVYTIVDTVTDAGGSLVLSRVVKNSSNQSTDAYTFTNIYSNSVLSQMIPKTGDNSSVVLLVVMTAIAGIIALLCIIFFWKRKRDREE